MTDFILKMPTKCPAILFILCLVWKTGLAQNSAYFHVQFDASSEIDSVSVLYRELYLVNTGDEYQVRAMLTPKTSSVTLPVRHGAGKFQAIHVFSKGEHRIYGEYLLHPGDSIVLKRDPSSGICTFEGRGADKYEVRKMLEDLHANYMNQRYEMVIKSNGTFHQTQNLEKVEALYIRARDSAKVILDRFRELADPIAYDVTLADWTAAVESSWQWELTLFHKEANPVNKERIYRAFKSIYSPPIRDKAVALSFNYQEYLIRRTRNETIFETKTQHSFEDIFDRLEANFSAGTRERLLMLWIIQATYLDYSLHSVSRETYLTCIERALAVTGSPEVRKTLNVFKNKLYYNYQTDTMALQGKDDEIIRLDNFSGKIVLLDFWYTGCSGCAAFFGKFEREVQPLFESEDRFVVVSISTDKRHETWRKSVAGGKYTSEKHVNAFTGGKGSQHPLVEYFRIDAFPFLMLLDESGQPLARISHMIKPEELIAMINDALQKSSPSEGGNR